MFRSIIFAILLMANFHCFAITATSWLVADYRGKIIDGENTKKVRSIASITKLVTVMVVLDARQPLDEKINTYTRKQLIQLALIKSDNNSAKVLCENYIGGKTRCVSAMNSKMKSLGLTETRFVEPTGLSIMNVSTAEELVVLVLEAVKYSEIVDASGTSQLKIKTKKKSIFIRNTNPIIQKEHNVIVSKTGYIRASGGCIVMMLDTDIGRRIVILLGSKNTKTRIPEAKYIAEHI